MVMPVAGSIGSSPPQPARRTPTSNRGAMGTAGFNGGLPCGGVRAPDRELSGASMPDGVRRGKARAHPEAVASSIRPTGCAPTHRQSLGRRPPQGIEEQLERIPRLPAEVWREGEEHDLA